MPAKAGIQARFRTKYKQMPGFRHAPE